jgi:hypothetical protein
MDHLAQPVTRCPRADGGPANDIQNMHPDFVFRHRAATRDAANAEFEASWKAGMEEAIEREAPPDGIR